jgi:hypothetical protein
MADQPERPQTDEQGPPPTPFDHPLFLPVILIGLTLWFGYDGFISDDPDMQEHLTFNRGGFAVTLLASIWFGWKGLKEWRQTRGERSRREEESEGSRPPPIA